METIDTVVIGAGVVGLACARALAMAGREVIILDAADAIGTETSSRNSEVIHAGIYYPTGSLKAQLCVEGRRALYDYADAHGVALNRCGKLIVATSAAEAAALDKIRAQAHANGVTDVAPIALTEVAKMEPAVRCVAALHSPSTGVIDSHGFMLALQGDAESHGAMLALKSPIEGGALAGDGIELRVGGESPMRIKARQIVNCAGLWAPRIAQMIEGFPATHIPSAHFCKGNYYTLTGRSPFKRLIYPIPEAAGLGVHVTIDLGGQARFGPDVEWLAGPPTARTYDVDPARAAVFYAAIRKYWPDLRDGQLAPGYSGIRPKLGPASSAAADFVIATPMVHGVPGVVHLFGIESPGLTAALAIADRVRAALDA